MNQSHRFQRKTLAILLAGLLVFVAGCGNEAAPASAPVESEAETSAIRVLTTTASRGDLSRGTEFVGRLEAAESVKVFPKNQGQIVHTYFSAGDVVQAGDLLFELDTEDLETNLELAYLQYQTAVIGAETSLMNAERTKENSARQYVTVKDNWEDLEEDYDDQRSALRDARDLAKNELDKAQKEYDEKYEGASAEEKKTLEAALKKAKTEYEAAATAFTTFVNTYEKTEDTYKTNKKNAKTDLEYAERAYDLVSGGGDGETLGSAESAIRQAQLSYERAQKALEDAKVYAPISGVITTKNADDSDMVAMTNPVYVISSQDKAPVVSFNLSEDGANALSVGDGVTVVYNGKEYQATIIEMAAEADAATGLYAAKAQPVVPLESVRSGAVVKVKASTANAQDELILPLDLIEYDENQPYVYVYRDGVAVRVDLVTGVSTADSIVIESGLTDEDQIITTWHPDLKDGAAVYAPSLEASASQPEEASSGDSSEEQPQESSSSAGDEKGE